MTSIGLGLGPNRRCCFVVTQLPRTDLDAIDTASAAQIRAFIRVASSKSPRCLDLGLGNGAAGILEACLELGRQLLNRCR